MDKYEFNIKVEQIKKLIKKKDYETAAKIADTIDWTKVKENPLLVMIADVYEITKQYEKAREELLLAYERTGLGRQLAYRLCRLSVKRGDFKEAQEFYDEFVENSPKDSGKYILQYEIARGRGESLENQIEILKTYLEDDMDDRWAYELAKLYHKNNMADECIEMCDTIVLWFADGKYVDKALELKKLYGPLPESQAKKYEKEPDGDNIDEVKEPDIDVNDIHVKDYTTSAVYDTVNLQKEIAKGMSKIMDEVGQTQVFEPVHTTEKVKENDKDSQGNTGDDDQIEGQMNLEEVLAMYNENSEPVVEKTVAGGFGQPEEENRASELTEKDIDGLEDYIDEPFEENQTEYIDQIIHQEDEIIEDSDIASYDGQYIGQEDIQEAIIENEKEYTDNIEDLWEHREETVENENFQESLEEGKESENLQESSEEETESENLQESLEEETESENPQESLEEETESENPQESLEEWTEGENLQESLEEEAEKENLHESGENMTGAYVKKNPDEEKNGIKEELVGFIDKFAGVRGLDKQILKAMQTVIKKDRNTTRFILVKGEVKSGKTTMALEFIKLANKVMGNRGQKIAKIKGSAINGKSVDAFVSKVTGSDILIERFTDMSEKEFMALMDKLREINEPRLVVFEDEISMANSFLKNADKEYAEFENVIEIRQNNINDWTKVAMEYANSKGYTIDEMGSLALSAKIDQLRAITLVVHKNHIEQLIDAAIEKHKKFGISKMFKKTKDQDGYTVLKEKDFLI